MRLCEEKNEEEESNEIQTECCACEEAKYEVMFQVSFFRQTKHFFLLNTVVNNAKFLNGTI